VKVTGIFNIKGRGWVVEIEYPSALSLPELGTVIINEKSKEIGKVKGVESFTKGWTRGETIGIIVGGDTRPTCTHLGFKVKS